MISVGCENLNQRLASNDECAVKHMVGSLRPGFVLLVSKVSVEVYQIFFN